VKALATKPSLTFLMVYSGSWFDPALGKQLALAQIAEGVAGIFNVSGGTGIGEMQGIAEAHANAGTTSGPPYYFGVDSCNDWWEMGQFCPMSMLKRVDLEAYDAVKVRSQGKFTGGRILVGVAEGMVYVSTEEDLIQAIDGQISTGTIAAGDKDTILANWRANRATFADWIWTALEDLKAAIADGSLNEERMSGKDGSRTRPGTDKVHLELFLEPLPDQVLADRGEALRGRRCRDLHLLHRIDQPFLLFVRQLPYRNGLRKSRDPAYFLCSFLTDPGEGSGQEFP